MSKNRRAVDDAILRLSRVLSDANLSKSTASALSQRVTVIRAASRSEQQLALDRAVDELLLYLHRHIEVGLPASAAMHLANAAILGIKCQISSPAKCYRAAASFVEHVLHTVDDLQTLTRIRAQRYEIDPSEAKSIVASAQKLIGSLGLAERTSEHLRMRISNITSLALRLQHQPTPKGGGDPAALELDEILHAFELELGALADEDLTGDDAAHLALVPIIVLGSVAALTIGGVYYAATHGVHAVTNALETLANTSPLEKWEIAHAVARHCGNMSHANRRRVISNLRGIQAGPPPLGPGSTNDHIEAIIRYINRL